MFPYKMYIHCLVLYLKSMYQVQKHLIQDLR